MTDLTRLSTVYKFSLELNGLTSPLCGAVTPTLSSLEIATSTTSQ